MRKTFRYRIFPSKKQTTLLNQTLDECRWLYNYLLEQRKNAWEKNKKSLSCFDQCNIFKQLKKERSSLKQIHSQVLQNVAIRIELAFQAFFRRVKRGEKPGYPRFRGKSRYDSFTYPQTGFKFFNDEDSIRLSKIGRIKTRLHRLIEGQIKTCTIRKTPTNKWFISFSAIVEKPTIRTIPKVSTGIDVGLESFATFSNGEKINNPHFFKQEEKALAKAQRKLSKQSKGTPERNKARKVVARVHERIANKRHNFIHQIARKLVDRFSLIAVEDLSINEMRKDNFRCINKSIGDVAWRMFLECISYKAEWAGKKCVQVNPAYTSQTCSRCGFRQKLELSSRIYHCLCCDFSLDRDHNAAINILALGLQSLGLAKEAVCFS